MKPSRVHKLKCEQLPHVTVQQSRWKMPLIRSTIDGLHSVQQSPQVPQLGISRIEPPGVGTTPPGVMGPGARPGAPIGPCGMGAACVAPVGPGCWTKTDPVLIGVVVMGDIAGAPGWTVGCMLLVCTTGAGSGATRVLCTVKGGRGANGCGVLPVQ